MLKAMRTGAKSIVVKVVLFGLLLLAMAGLALMDVQGMFRGGVSNTTVAKIGDSKITASEFERMVSNTLQDKNIPQNVAVMLGVPRQVLSREVTSRVFNRAARDMGVIPDDTMAAKNIQTILAPYVKEGMTREDALSRFLATAGMNEGNLVTTIKSQMATETLVKLVASGARAPQQLIEDAAKYQHEERRGAYFVVSAADAGKAAVPTEEALQEYYKTVGAQFALPETRDLDVLVLDKKALGISAATDEAALKKYYEDHKDDYSAPETRLVAQAVAPDEAAAKAVYDAAVKSKNLKAAASSAKANYIKAAAVTEKEMPVELSPAAFKAQAGEVLPPVQSPLGWIVMHVEKVTPASVKSFDSVRAEIAKEAGDDKSSEALYEQANKIDDLLASGKTLDEVASQYNLKPVTLTKVDAQGKNVNANSVPALPKVLEHAFRIGKGETSPMIEAPGGEFVIVSARDITPSENPPFASVREAVLASWKQRENTNLLDTQSAKITERLKLGENFDKIAASFNKSPSATSFLARNADAAKAGLDKALVPALFSLQKQGDATAVPGKDVIIVVRLADRRIAAPQAQSKEDTAALAASLNRSLQSSILDQYRAVLVKKYDVTINDKLVDDLFRAREEEN